MSNRLINKNFFTLLLVLFIITGNSYAQLVGGNTYPINGTENPPVSFQSISSAVTYLNTNGVTGTGDVILELSTGYAGDTSPISIGVISGTSSTTRVVFRPASGYTALTEIPGGASPNQHAIRITGNYIVLDGRAGGVGTSRDWTIRTTGSTNGQMAVRLDNTSNSMTGVELRYLVMEAEVANITGAIFQITGSTTNTITNIIVEENLIRSNPLVSTFRGYGITLASASNAGNTGIIVRNNIITQFYARGINLTGGFPGIEVYGNEIYHTANVTQPSTTEFSAIYFSTTTSPGAKIYNNYIHDIRLTNGATAINGLYIFNGNSSGASVQYFNNRISIGGELSGTAAALPVFGLRENTLSGVLIDIYYNSVYVGGTLASGSNSSAAFRKQASNFVSLKNNIFYNARTNSGGTGTHWAIMSNNITYSSIGNNDYYADGSGGVLGTTDGTTAGNRLTLADWQTAVPSDNGSVSQNPNFVAGLKINETIATQLESGGVPISGITADFEGDLRNATTPDIGADEFTGTPLDLTPPTISFTPLLNTGSTSARTLVASISDLSGVPTSGIGLPVLYWKINSGGTWTGATATYLSGSNYQFSFGSGVAAGDTVFYYVVAQDNATTPNVAAFPSAGASGFTANPPAAATPPTSPYGYLITQASLAGDYTVGTSMFNQITGKNIYFEKVVRKVMKEVWVANPQSDVKDDNRIDEPVLYGDKKSGSYQMMEVEEVTWIPMENGLPYNGDLYVKKSENTELAFPEGIEGVYATITAAINDLNFRGVAGNVNFLLTDALYSTGETFPIIVNITNESLPSSTKKVTIKPNTGVTAAIRGSSSTGIFVSFGVDYINIDGSNSGGTDRSLTIENTSTAANHYVVGIFNNGVKGAQNNTIKNCIIKGGSNTSASWGVILNFSGGDYDNTVIQNNEFRKTYTGMQFVGVTTGITNGGSVSKNIFGNDADSLSLGNVGVVLSYVDGLSFTENTIKNVKVGNNPTGIFVFTSTLNTSITRNLITGIVYTGTGGYGGKGIDINTASATSGLTVANNMISNISGDGWSTLTSDAIVGIRVLGTTGGINFYYNSVNLYGNANRSTATNSAAIYIPGNSGFDLINNIFANSIVNNTTSTSKAYAIYNAGTNAAFSVINNNDYFASGSQGILGYLGADISTLSGWQAATGQDANSINLDPKFLSNTDLHIDPAFNNVDAKAVYLAAVPNDFDGQSRNATTPDIGADEYTYIPPSVDDPSNVTATAVSNTQINVAFTPNSSNNNVVVVWNSTGAFTVPSGTPTVGGTLAGGTVLSVGTTSPVLHTGLTGGTTYYYKLFSYNGTSYSPGVTANATTQPDPITSFPYVQDFEGSFPPTGWSNYGTKLWTQTLTGGLSGSKGARVSYTPAGSANLQTPPVVLPAAPHRIRFWWKDNDISSRPLSNNGEASNEGPEIIGQDTTYFEISTDAGTTWTSLAFLSAASPQSAYSEVVVDLTSYTNQTVSFRWRDESNGTFSAYGTGLDQITIEEIPATPIFVITPTSQNFGSAIVGNTVSRNFTISNTGSVTLTINTGGITLTGANADQFSLGSITYPINLNNGESTQITVNFTPTSAGAKTANLQIVHNAPGSPAVVPLTGNALPTGTLFEDFTGTTFPPDGWIAVNNDGGAENWFRSTSKFNSSPASAASSYESSTLRNDDWLISPKVSVNTGDSLVFFSSIQSSAYPEILVIKVGTTADPNGSWTTLDSVVQSSTNWIRRSYSLSAFAGQNVYIAFVNRGLDEWVLYIDDVQGPVKYTPAIDLALQDFYQSTGLPVPRNGEKFSDYRISLSTENLSDTKPFAKLDNFGLGLRASNSNYTIVVESTNNLPFELNNVQIKGEVKNIGLNASSYTLNWNVSGTSQTPYSGPTVNSGSVDTVNLTYTPGATGTFLTSGTLVVTGDEVPGNDSRQFRMRVYPDSYTRTIYDRGDNIVDTWVGWGNSTTRMKAGVRFTAPEQIKLAGVDFISRTEAVSSGTFEVQVRAAGDSSGAPGAVLYTQVYSANDYFAGAGDYIFFPFGNDAPTIASGSDYWITVKAPLGVLYPGAVHNTGFTAGRSFYEGSADTTVWNPLVITTERAWIMRAVHIPAAATFQLTVNVSNGWNMVSVPGQHPVDQNVTTWWSGKDPAANVFKFQGAYQPVTTVQPGLGYWMKHLGANTYNTGDEWPAGGINVVPHDPLTAAAGWNLIGGYEFLAPTAALTTTPSGLISGFVYGYTPGTGYQVASDLVPGYGYWVKLTAAGQINVNPGPKANFKLSDFIPDDFGKIIITDNAGKSYTLYVAQGKQAQKTSLDLFELPPVPFSDIFDVRYTSGRFVEDLGSAMKTIQMQGVEYPVRVRVEGMMLRITDETGKAINERVKSGEEITISNSQISKLNVMGDIIPDKYSLEQNYPNPFNPTTTIEFSLPEDVENVRLTIYNALGEKVGELVNGKMEAGRYRYQWNAGNVATGLYIYELKTNKFSSVKKMMLLK